MMELNAIPWTREIRAEEIALRSKPNLFSMFQAAMDIEAESQGARAWMCKSMGVIDFWPELLHHFPAAKFLHLVRDPRDACASLKFSDVGAELVAADAANWLRLHDRCLQLKEAVAPDQYFCILYEDLIEDPETSLRAVCDFLNIRYSESMLRFHLSREAIQCAACAARWANLTRPLNNKRIGRYRNSLTDGELESVLSIYSTSAFKPYRFESAG